MKFRLRPLLCATAFALLAACSSAPVTNSLGELPQPSQASIEQLLNQAGGSQSEQANLLRLTAADKAYAQQNSRETRQILGMINLQGLKPAQQIFAQTLLAQLDLLDKQPAQALKRFNDASFAQLGELPAQQQIRSGLTKAEALAANDQPLAAAQERVFIGPLLQGEAAHQNRERIWQLVSSLPDAQLRQNVKDADLNGWLALAAVTRGNLALDQQLAAIEEWQKQHPGHPAAQQLPDDLERLKTLAREPLNRVALLLPMQGQLAGVSRALQDGFMAARYEALAAGQPAPAVTLYDSTQIGTLDNFYRQAQAAGIQLVVGPLEKNLVKQLGDRPQLPINTLALNYGDGQGAQPPQLFQFGLAAEDEARDAARRAWADGKRSAGALVPQGDWGTRVLAAFQDEWQKLGGRLVAAERIGQPVEIANRISSLLQMRQGMDFIFLAATPAQARQINPILAYQNARDLPVYATSNLNSGVNEPGVNQDLNGIMFCETPWLLDSSNPLRAKITAQWPQAATSIGRLYAMGADAYLLALHLQQLKALPNSELPGLSGDLSVAADQRVVRDLPWAVFRNGVAQPLPASSASLPAASIPPSLSTP
ncbi:penicillin-binding protein activator [Pseudomonas oryzihabitans]|uniref:penicillin-binding protein activator n=1 Tax=Pseudomonas oryzihabitans TaxID=47885 RepID=UPI00285ADC0A|nr:penicillin-binding protein activator [Pseudomonas psychrotolerans]MDR6678820.1 outer membrane PBP1 activator LpoA protein [Pseudomonas psychrotolerans]